MPREYFVQRWAQQRTEMVMDQTEAEDIKKSGQEYTEEVYKKDLHEPDNHDGMITHIEPDISGMQSQVGLRKHHYEQLVEVMEFQLSYFKS